MSRRPATLGHEVQRPSTPTLRKCVTITPGERDRAVGVCLLCRSVVYGGEMMQDAATTIDTIEMLERLYGAPLERAVL